MNEQKSAASNHSMVSIKSARQLSIYTEDHILDDREGYMKYTLKKSFYNEKEEPSSLDEEKHPASSDDEDETSSKRITLCTMCGRYKGFQMRRKLFIILSITILLLLLLLGILLGFYVIIPVIVRSTIDKAQLSFRSINIQDIQHDRFRLKAQLELSRTGSIAATILPPLIINVDNVGTVRNDQPIVITGDSDHSTIVPIDSPFVVSNLEAFNTFTRSLIFSSQVIWHLTAKASIQPISSSMPIYSNIPFNKQVTFNAFNGLKNVSIRSLSLRRSDAQHIFADIIIEIPNPSIFTIDLGKLTFSLHYNNVSIGYAQSIHHNITLHPGINVISLEGELQSKSSQSYTSLSTIIQNFLTGKGSKIEAIAGSNATSYSLLASGMEGLSLDVEMPPFDEQLIPLLIFNSMSLIPSTHEKQVLLSASISIRINSPLGHQSPLHINSMDMNVILFYDNSSVGMLNVSQAPVQQLDENTYKSEFNNKHLLLSDNGKTYEKFAQHFINANDTHFIHFRVVGFASISGSFALGALNINGVHIENDVSLVGLGGLNNVYVHGISVDGEKDRALQLAIRVTINNPSVTDVQLKDFTLHMADSRSGIVLGQVPIDLLSLQPGDNTITLNGLLAPSKHTDLAVVGKFFSAYLNNQTQSVTLFHELSTNENATGMDLTISGLSMKADLDGIETQLIHRLEILNFGIEFDRRIVNKVYVSGQLLVVFKLPPSVHIKCKLLTATIDYRMRFRDGPTMGQMILYNMPVKHNQLTNEVLLSFTKQELVVLDKRSFQDFAANLVLTNNVSVKIEGLAEALAQVIIGNITLSDVPLHDTLHLVGYDRFDNGLLHIDEIDLSGALSSHILALRVKTSINNPSAVYIVDGGRLSLDLCEFTSGISLGVVIIDPFYLDQQGNSTTLNAVGTVMITQSNADIVQEFISRMVCGIDNEVELRGKLPDNSFGSSIPLLSIAVGGLRIRTIVPGLSGEKALVREILLKKLSLLTILGLPLGIVKTLSARIRLRNPFSAPLTITSMNMRADYGAVINNARQVGTVTDNSRITIGAYEDILTPYIKVEVKAKLSTMVSLLTPLLDGAFPLSLSGTIDVIIDNQLTLTHLPLTLLNINTVSPETKYQ